MRYFANKYARRMNKQIETIPSETMETLVQWHWPGNVRELENIIERAVILTQGPVLRVPVAQFKLPSESTPASVVTMEEAERQHILRTLDETNWTISGPHGAAARLGLKRTTLQSRMQKLGIKARLSRGVALGSKRPITADISADAGISASPTHSDRGRLADLKSSIYI